MGVPLMPWQRQVADVLGEIDPATGLPAYRGVVVTVPRQSGKTELILCVEIQRANGWEKPQRLLYSAQTGNDARKKLVEDQMPRLEPIKHRLGIKRFLRGAGNEAIEFTNGSRLGLLASAQESGHGKTVDLAIRDELFADFDDRREQAMIPAMATRPAAQMLTCSTMGTDESLPLNRAVELGRAAVDSGKRNGLAYFEWSADPADDPDDPAVWRRCMPALGFTITEDVVAHARASMTDGEFRRAFLNIPTRSDERVIPGPAWDAVCRPEARPEGRLVFSVDVNPERSMASIVAASCGAHRVVELVDHRAGTGWLVDRAVELDGRWGRPSWFVDAQGPAGALIGDLERRGLKVQPVRARDVVDACGSFFDDVLEKRLVVRTHPALDDAAAAAAKRTVGDAWAWVRKEAAADITPLVAATLAAWGARGDKPAPHVGFFSLDEV